MRPGGLGIGVLGLRYPPRTCSVSVGSVEVPIPAEVASPGELGAVGGPRGVFVLIGRIGQPTLPGAVGVHYPNVSVGTRRVSLERDTKPERREGRISGRVPRAQQRPFAAIGIDGVNRAAAPVGDLPV